MASAKKGTVGVIGLGIMGGAFAQNLIAAGFHVIGYDVAPDRRRALAKAGAEIADDAADVARKSRIVLTSLPKPAALAETAVAIAKARLPRRVIVEMSTFTSKTRPAPRRCCARPVTSCSIVRSAAPAPRPR